MKHSRVPSIHACAISSYARSKPNCARSSLRRATALNCPVTHGQTYCLSTVSQLTQLGRRGRSPKLKKLLRAGRQLQHEIKTELLLEEASSKHPSMVPMKLSSTGKPRGLTSSVSTMRTSTTQSDATCSALRDARLRSAEWSFDHPNWGCVTCGMGGRGTQNTSFSPPPSLRPLTCPP